MTRRNAALAGLVAWLVALLFAPEKSARGMAVWGVVAAIAVTLSIVAARTLSREVKKIGDPK